MIRRAVCAAALMFAAFTAAAESPRYQIITYDQLTGWTRDYHEQALRAFLTGCSELRTGGLVKPEDTDGLCSRAGLSAGRARMFFEEYFTPVVITDGDVPRFTGFFEPVLRGSREPTTLYPFPLYRLPPGENPEELQYSRSQIGEGALDGKGLELVWLQNPIDAYYVHIQGSARFELTDGSTMRIGYAGRNGHRYRSVARTLIDQGKLAPSEGTIDGLKRFHESDPEAALLALNINPSFIFFRELDLPDDLGPLGALASWTVRRRCLRQAFRSRFDRCQTSHPWCPARRARSEDCRQRPRNRPWDPVRREA